MDNFEADLLTLTDEDGVEMEFQILDTIEHEGNRYLALLPTEEADDEDENGSYYILREEEDENGGDPMLAEVEDEDLLDELAAVFEQHFSEMYDDEEEDEADENENK